MSNRTMLLLSIIGLGLLVGVCSLQYVNDKPTPTNAIAPCFVYIETPHGNWCR